MGVFLMIIGSLSFGLLAAATVRLNQVVKRLDEIAALLRERGISN